MSFLSALLPKLGLSFLFHFSFPPFLPTTLITLWAYLHLPLDTRDLFLPSLSQMKNIPGKIPFSFTLLLALLLCSLALLLLGQYGLLYQPLSEFLLSLRLLFHPEDVPTKCQQISIRLHCIISQETLLLRTRYNEQTFSYLHNYKSDTFVPEIYNLFKSIKEEIAAPSGLFPSGTSILTNSSMRSLLSCDSGTEKNVLCCQKCCHQHPWRLLGILYPSIIQLRFCASSFYVCGSPKKRNSPADLGHDAAKEANDNLDFFNMSQ